MAHIPSRRPATIALIDPEDDVLSGMTCPMCHTLDTTVTPAGMKAGGDWRCVRCGRRWDDEGLSAVAAYAEWRVEHDRP